MNQEDSVITLTDDEGNEENFTLIDVIELKDQRYAILFPLGEEGTDKDTDADDEEQEAIILKFTKDEEGNDMLVSLEDEEWEEVADAWAQMVEED